MEGIREGDIMDYLRRLHNSCATTLDYHRFASSINCPFSTIESSRVRVTNLSGAVPAPQDWQLGSAAKGALIRRGLRSLAMWRALGDHENDMHCVTYVACI